MRTMLLWATLALWALLALPGHPAAAQVPIPGLPFWEWQPGLPTGFGLKEAQALNDSTLVAVGSHGTAIKTTNGGRSWRTLPTGQVREMTSVAFATAQVGWLAGETDVTTSLHVKAGPGRVLRTTDGGQHWTPQDLGEPTLSVVQPRVTVVSATEAYVSYQLTGRSGPPNNFNLPYEPRLRHTVNGGQTWTPVNLPAAFNSLYTFTDLVFPTPTTGLLLVYNGYASNQLLRTTDGGQTWQNILPGIASDVVLSQVLFVDSQHGFLVGRDVSSFRTLLYRTADAGATWAPVPLSAAVLALELGLLSFADPQHGLAVGSGNQWYTTADGGLSWNPAGYVPGALQFNLHNRLHPGGTGWAFSPNTNALYRTLDYGQHFAPAGPPPVANYRALHFPDPTHGWALPRFHDLDHALTLLRTADRGASWQPVQPDSLATGLHWTNAQLLGAAFPDADTAWAVGS